MTEGVSVDLGGLLPYLEDKVRRLFGRDPEHVAAREALERHLRLATREAGSVQIVGMDQPVSIFDIYQPTLLTRHRDGRTATFEELVTGGDNVVIFAGPGRGKTMLLRYMFATLAQRKQLLPLLFTLRWPTAPEDLSIFVRSFSKGILRADPNTPIVLLVDGFDEISVASRRDVAKVLGEFATLDVGGFYLTCRSHYSVDDIQAAHWHIAPFTSDDAARFIAAFAVAYGSVIDPRDLLTDLRRRGFDDFVGHPLLLALVCILKSGPLPDLPRTTIGLVRRALDTLTFRWDESKKVHRESRYDLDGDDRVRCLARIAFAMKTLVEPGDVVLGATRTHLRLLQRSDVNADRLLEELTQWYGLLIPLNEERWSFVHRTIHDYLAARFWVETAGFDPDRVAEWTPRAAYAACLTGDGTRSMVAALEGSDDVAAFGECLANLASFDVERVAQAVVEHFILFPRSFRAESDEKGISLGTAKDFWHLASGEFIYSLMSAGLSGRSLAHQLVSWCSVIQLRARRAPIPENARRVIIELFGATTSVDLTIGERRFLGTVAELLGATVPMA
jgi:hypothetical protein